MVDRVFPAPVIVGGERQDAGDETDDVIGAPRVEIGAMSAVVKDDEDAHQEGGSQNGWWQREPERHCQCAVDYIPEQQVGNERTYELPQDGRSYGATMLRHARLSMRPGAFVEVPLLSIAACHAGDRDDPRVMLHRVGRRYATELRRWQRRCVHVDTLDRRLWVRFAANELPPVNAFWSLTMCDLPVRHRHEAVLAEAGGARWSMEAATAGTGEPLTGPERSLKHRRAHGNTSQ
jgi:hypothetical protein